MQMIDLFIVMDHILHEGLLPAHSIYNEQSFKEVFLLLTAVKTLSCSLCPDACYLAAKIISDLFLRAFLFLKKLVIFNLNKFISLLWEALGPVIRLVEIVRVKELHEADVDIGLHAPDPLSAEGNAELSSNSLTISCHQ